MVSCMNWLKTLTTLAHLPSHYCIISQVYSIKHSTLREGGRGREGRVIILHMNLLVQWMVFQMIFHLVSTLHSQGTVNPRKNHTFFFLSSQTHLHYYDVMTRLSYWITQWTDDILKSTISNIMITVSGFDLTWFSSLSDGTFDKFSANVFPVTVRQSPCSRPAVRSSFCTTFREKRKEGNRNCMSLSLQAVHQSHVSQPCDTKKEREGGI